jgi:hypothetical protein
MRWHSEHSANHAPNMSLIGTHGFPGWRFAKVECTAPGSLIDRLVQQSFGVQRQEFDLAGWSSVKVLAGILTDRLVQQSLGMQLQEFGLAGWRSDKVLACSVRNLDWQVGAATKFWRAASGILTDRLE